jgi:adenylate kinase
MELQDKNLRKEKWAIILIGPIGAGKGTQADLLAEDFGLYHFETSKIIREKFDTADSSDLAIQTEKAKYERGELTDPATVLRWVLEKIASLASQDTGIVFSGSPRTVLEAEGELPVLHQHYGKENVKFVFINISEAEAIKRSAGRRVCQANGHPIPNFLEFREMKVCPKDGSPLIRKAGGLDDDPEKIKKRYNGFAPDMHAVLEYAKNLGHSIIEINGEDTIEAVHDRIVSHIFKLHASDHKEILEKVSI